MMIKWIGFFIAVVILLVVSRKHLGLSFMIGGIVLGVFTLPLSEIPVQIFQTLTDPSVILLTGALSLIPIVAGVLQESGKLDQIVENLRVGRKGFLGLSPALLGLLPIPGGALFSAPLVDKAGGNLTGGIKSGINIWFRHILFFIYPLSPNLIIPASIAKLSIYTIIKYQFPIFLITIAIGYFFLLKNSTGDIEYSTDFSMKKLFYPLSVILIAPILDLTLKTLLKLEISEISTLIAISSSLILAIYIGRPRKSVLKKSISKMKPWNFGTIILGIYIFINIFESSGIGSLIAALSPSRFSLGIVFGLLLGAITGRIYLPASIIIPIYLSAFTLNSLSPVVFALMFFSIFLGYIISPVHPCVGLSLEYFDAEMIDFLKVMFLPVTISIIAVTVAFFLLI